MLKVTGGKMPAALSLLPFTVLADAGVGEKEAPAPLNRDELSLYAAPPALKSRHPEPEAGQLEQSVATVRKAVEPYATWCKGIYTKIKPKVQGVVQYGNDSYTYLKDPPKDFYPRAGVIAFTGVLGLFLARGSKIKKLIYPTGLVALSTSLYYPEQAAAIAKSTGDRVYDSAVQSLASLEKMVNPGSKPEKKPTETETKP